MYEYNFLISTKRQLHSKLNIEDSKAVAIMFLRGHITILYGFISTCLNVSDHSNPN